MHPVSRASVVTACAWCSSVPLCPTDKCCCLCKLFELFSSDSSLPYKKCSGPGSLVLSTVSLQFYDQSVLISIMFGNRAFPYFVWKRVCARCVWSSFFFEHLLCAGEMHVDINKILLCASAKTHSSSRYTP